MPGWTIQTPAFVRYPLVPCTALRSVRNEEVVTQIDDLLRRNGARQSLRIELEELLYRRIGESPAHLKPRLIGLRRAVHNDRIPRAGEASKEILEFLSPHETRTLEEWRTNLQDELRQVTQLDRNIELDPHSWVAPTARLQHFRHALEMASPSLATQAFQQQRIVSRHTRTAVLRYLSRAAAKTSPYSTFTATALATTEASPFTNQRIHLIREFDQYLLERFLERLLTIPALRRYASVSLNSSTVAHDGSLWIIGKRPKEPIVRIGCSPAIEQVLAAAISPSQTLKEFSEKLTQKLKEPNPELINHLIGVGLLELTAPFDEDAEDVLSKTADWCRRSGENILAEHFEELSDAMRPRAASPDVRAGDTLRQAYSAASAIARELREPNWPIDSEKAKYLFHEQALDLVAKPLPAAITSPNTARDLGALTELLSVFDRMLPVKIAAAEAFKEWNPVQPVSFLEFYRNIQQLLKDQTAGKQVPPYLRLLELARPVTAEDVEAADLPRLRELLSIRAMVRASLQAQNIADHPIPPKIAFSLMERFPDWIPLRSSATYYLQVTGPELFINVIGAGDGRGRSRWWRLQHLAQSEPLRPLPSTEESKGAVPVSLPGAFGASGNLVSPPSTRFIRYPHTHAHGVDENAIHLRDLALTMDRHTRLVLTDKVGNIIRPGYSGLLAEPLMPPAARFLFALFGNSNLKHPAFPIVQSLVPPEKGCVHTIPRVQIGNIVLERRKWVCLSEDIPVKRSMRAQQMMELEAWRRQHDIPENVFIRMESASHDWRTQAFGKQRKPQFINLRSPDFIEVLVDIVTQGRGNVILEEANPDVLNGAEVNEYVIEVGADSERLITG